MGFSTAAPTIPGSPALPKTRRRTNSRILDAPAQCLIAVPKYAGDHSGNNPKDLSLNQGLPAKCQLSAGPSTPPTGRIVASAFALQADQPRRRMMLMLQSAPLHVMTIYCFINQPSWQRCHSLSHLHLPGRMSAYSISSWSAGSSGVNF
jgi:hypothetical protein